MIGPREWGHVGRTGTSVGIDDNGRIWVAVKLDAAVERRPRPFRPARRRIDPQETLARLKANKPDRLPRLER